MTAAAVSAGGPHGRPSVGYPATMADLTARTKQLAASTGGAALAGAVRVIAAVRPAAKPLHPRGDLVPATLRRTGTAPATGAAWLDEAGTDDVTVRRSRSIGLPEGFPDIHGLAIRVPVTPGRHGDLLLASTGRSRVTRFLFTAGRSPSSRPLTTLLPYRTPTGPKLISAVARDDHSYELAFASPGGAWHAFGELVLASTPRPDVLVSFDPVCSTLPGLEQYEWVRRLREPAYRTARHSR